MASRNKDKNIKRLMILFMKDNLVKVLETYESTKKFGKSIKIYAGVSEVNLRLLLYMINIFWKTNERET